MIPFLSPYLWLIKVAAFVGALLIAYHEGGVRKQAKWDISIAKADAVAQEKYNRVSQELEDAKANQKAVTRTVIKWRDKVITRDVYRNVCMDDDGMRLFNESIKAKTAGELDAAMSGPDPAK